MHIIRRFFVTAFFSFFFIISVFAQEKDLNIGFLIPDRTSVAARDGALLAVKKANEQGGCDGKKFSLIIRSTAGLWGTGSKVAVSMIFDYDVLAIAASLDGRNAHLAEQITTKTKVAFVSTWSTDMTLSYAFVPWFFRVIPDDMTQGRSLLQGIAGLKEKTGDVLLVSEDTYDAKNAMGTFMKIVEKRTGNIPRQMLIKKESGTDDPGMTDFSIPAAETYLLFGTPALAAAFLEQYHHRGLTAPVFGNLSITDDRQAHTQDLSRLENVVTISPGFWFTDKGIAFQKNFRKQYGYDPGPAAAYAYDGINVIIEAVRKAGTNRNRIIGYLSGIRYEGVTGEIRFDDKGNRREQPRLMIIRNGKPSSF